MVLWPSAQCKSLYQILRHLVAHQGKDNLQVKLKIAILYWTHQEWKVCISLQIVHTIFSEKIRFYRRTHQQPYEQNQKTFCHSFCMITDCSTFSGHETSLWDKLSYQPGSVAWPHGTKLMAGPRARLHHQSTAPS